MERCGGRGGGGGAVWCVCSSPRDIPNRITGTGSASLALNTFSGDQAAEEFGRRNNKERREPERVSLNASRRASAKANIHTTRMDLTSGPSWPWEIDGFPAPPSHKITNGRTIRRAISHLPPPPSPARRRRRKARL